VKRAAHHFGKLDIVVNNAGYGHFGMIEELTEDEVRAQLETNLFGALWVTQAALPIMSAQGSGHIVPVSSLGGITAFPAIGAYHASKWALESRSRPAITSRAWRRGTSGSPSRSRPTGHSDEKRIIKAHSTQGSSCLLGDDGGARDAIVRSTPRADEQR
jgi:hypothetical protein